MRSTTTLFIALLAGLLSGGAVTSAAAERDSTAVAPAGAAWRTVDPPTPATGPSELAVSLASLASTVDGKRKLSKQANVPRIELVVLDEAGRPLPGIEVRVGVRGTKRDSKTVRLKGATTDAGRCALLPEEAIPVTAIGVDLAWDDGFKIVGFDLRADSGKWQLTEASYKDPITNDDRGSCKNLFAFEKGVPGANGIPVFRVTARLPATLLSCSEIDYGAERKTDQASRVEEIGSRNINRGDKNFFSESDEAKLGVEMSTQLDKDLEILDDRAIHDYVEQVMKKVVASSDEPSLPIKVRVVHTDDINAFCTMGGNIYVFTGLIKAAQNESMLAGVLAHELAHAEARHVTEGATRKIKAQAGAQIGAALLASALGMGSGSADMLIKGSSAAANVIGRHYDRRAEAEADLLGEQYLWKAGWDPEGIARFFEVLEARGASASVPGWLSTHPTHENRIRDGIVWARAFLPRKERYLVDTAAFQECKKRVMALPPPKKKPAPQP